MRWWSVVGVVSVVVFAPARAMAAGIVIESYAGHRPDDADRLLAPLMRELGSRGYVVGDALSKRIDSEVSRPGEAMSASALGDVRDAIDRADEAFVRGTWEDAHEAASHGLDALMRHPGTLAGNEELRRLHRHALIIAAESHRRVGNADRANEIMAEVVRTFPTIDISSARYSPAVTRFFNDVRRDLDEQETGTLVVNLDDPAAVIFVNERYVGAGQVSLALIPGTYRVLTRKGNESGRLHVTHVAAGAKTSLDASWSLDEALTTRDGYAALEHASSDAREQHEGRSAISIARRIGANGAIVVGIREFQGRRSIVGRVLSLDTGKATRTGTLAVEPIVPREETIRSLARYLAGEDIEGFAPPHPEEGRPATSGPPRPDIGEDGAWTRDPLGWSLAGVGVASAAAGLALLANASSLHDEANAEPFLSRRKSLRDDARRRRTTGIVTAGLGGALLIAGIVALALPPKATEQDRTSAWFHVGPTGVAIGGRF